ncbi:cell division protein DamX [Alteromonas sp. 14N.309.X.WAT.G.H12]|uniref:SPOR domain-containing protein n=1 Tax=Alteromonas sp. 14N.309.X.WAT.G.H12 TaxID=3120824 RepID=UPI002FD39CE6
MQSELHDRLEYLVNYSSQLIFVSGDTVAQQKKTLESFVFQQQDETEIAYLTADSSMDLSDYRRQLCRQLLGTLVGSFVRPLNELLAGLNEHVGPILITITQAEHIPDVLLQELWDLVLQSRFAGNKQHLNVLLFGETAWAENAKQWLPAKNTDTPLLISSKSVAAQQPGSELDTMIENRRKAFHEHLAKRNGYDEQIETKQRMSLGSPLFLSLIAILFLAVFSALIYWQYSDDINALFNPIENSPPQELGVKPGSAFNQLDDEKANNTDMPAASWDDATVAIDDEHHSNHANHETDEDLRSFIENISSDNTPSGNVAETTTTDKAAEESVSPQSNEAQPSAEPVKTIADSAVDAIASLPSSSQVSQSPLSVSGADFIAPQTPQNNGDKSQTTTDTLVQEATPSSVTKETSTTPSEDVIDSTEQAIAVTLPARPTFSEPTPDAAESVEPVAETPSQTFDSHDYDSKKLLEQIIVSDYVIQLAGLKHETLMNEFVEDNKLADHVWIYRTQRYGGDWFVLIYNQRFDSFAKANAARAELPPFHGRDDAFIKRGRDVIEEINKVAR